MTKTEDKMSLNESNSLKRCEVCGGIENLKVCSKCKFIYYCGKEHQKANWQEHKKICKKYQAASVVPDPQDFDPRPIKKCSAVKINAAIESVAAAVELSATVAKFLKTEGFCVLDGVCSEYDLQRALADVTKISHGGVMKPGQLAGGKTSGEDSQKVINKSIRNDNILWLNGTEFESYPGVCSVVTNIMDSVAKNLSTHFEDKYLIEDRTKAMVACYPGNGAAYTRHVDNPSGDGRLVTCILYLNKDWNSEQDGGVLRVFPQSTPNDYIDIEPLANRMIFFWSDLRTPHEVRPAYRERYAVTVWYFDKAQRLEAKEAELQNEMFAVRGRIALMDVKKKEVERDLIKEQIAAKSEQAVKNLSPSELQNFKTLLSGHENPREVLSFMGIGTTIQNALLKHLNIDIKD